MAAVSSISITLDMTKALQDATKQLARREVAIGIPDSGAERTPEPGAKTAPSNALLGYLLDQGDESRHLPARPFLLPGIASAKDDIVKRLTKTGQDVLGGNAGAVDKGLAAVGFVGQNAVRQKITDGPFAPLSARTLSARKAKGFKGTSPLIVTGQLRNSITFVLRDKGDD